MSTEPRTAVAPQVAARNLPELLQALQSLRRAPIVDLKQALLQLQVLDEATIAALDQEDPQLFHSRSRKLVERVVVSEFDWHHAMARVAGLPEIDALTFEIDPKALDVVSIDQARLYGVLPLGMVDELFFVAASKPTSDELQRQLQVATGGRSMPMVWAAADAIDRRLDQLDSPLI